MPQIRLAVGIWALGALLLLPAAFALSEPGFLDAYYYFHVAANLAAGLGFREDVIWNYLTIPSSLSHPSNYYWQPLTSVVAAPFMAVFGAGFRSAQLPMVLLSATVPTVTGLLAFRWSGSRLKAVTAAALVLFSWHYFPYWVALDTFALFALAAAAVFAATTSLLRQTEWKPCLLLGFGCAAAQLARADGPLLFVAAATTLAICGGRAQRRGQLLALSLAGASYLLIMLPWIIRNIAVTGTPIPGGGLQTVFLREYNDLFSFGVALDAEWYLANGIAPIFTSKLAAALRNLGVIFGLQYWLLPFSAIGWWTHRRSHHLAPVLVYGVLLYLVMTVVFTFPGSRGAMLHSGAALLPWLGITCVEGLDRAVRWAANKLPHWNAAGGLPRVAALLVGLSAGLSFALVIERSPQWHAQTDAYRAVVDTVFADNAGAVPLLNNPPGWWYVTHRPALQNPSNGREAAFAAARMFGGTHLILEPDRSREWHEFAQSGGADPRLLPLSRQAGYIVYRLVSP